MTPPPPHTHSLSRFPIHLRQDRLASLTDTFHDVMSRGEHCGWSAADHYEYIYIEEHYLSATAPKAVLKAGQTVRQLFLERLGMTM
jgi:hypothetical protein